MTTHNKTDRRREGAKHEDPLSMSARARAYLTVAACHFGIVGADILTYPGHYSAEAYEAVVDGGYLPYWGASYCLVSIICFGAVTSRWPSFARAGLIAAFVVLTLSAFAVGWGVVLSWNDSDRDSASVIVPISLAAIALKDLLMVAQPLRTPTEDQTQARHDQDDL